MIEKINFIVNFVHCSLRSLFIPLFYTVYTAVYSAIFYSVYSASGIN